MKSKKKGLHVLIRPVFSENISEEQKKRLISSLLRRPVFSETIGAEQGKDSKNFFSMGR